MNSPNQESPMQYFPRLRLSPSDIKYHAASGPADPELYAVFISEKETEALLSEAVAKAVADAVREAKAEGRAEGARSVVNHLEDFGNLSEEDTERGWALVHEMDAAAELRENGGKNVE